MVSAISAALDFSLWRLQYVLDEMQVNKGFRGNALTIQRSGYFV